MSELPPIEVSLTPEERFAEYLQSLGMRNTEQRKGLLEYVFSHHEHFDADQLIERLPRKGQPGYISRPTVYRTLSEFVDAGLLRKFQLDGRAVYEHDYGYPQHDHFYCTECSTLIEFQNKDLLQLRDTISRDHKFQVSTHRMIIHGICEQCQQERRRVRRKVDLI